jgi:hypothetical protein
MLELMKRVNNPLTLIALFASVAEIAGTVVLPFISDELQHLFVWFVMLFPVLLVILFFWTLQRNPTVLYAPSDFRDDASYLKVFSGLTVDLDSIDQKVETLSLKVDEAAGKISDTGQKERESIGALVKQELKGIQGAIANAKASVAEMPAEIDSSWAVAIKESKTYQFAKTKSHVLRALKKIGKPATISSLCIATKHSTPAVEVALAELVREGDVIMNTNEQYEIAPE